jgi:hypothetical protein
MSLPTAFFASSSPALDQALAEAHPEFFRSLKGWPATLVLLPASFAFAQIDRSHQVDEQTETSPLLILQGIFQPLTVDEPEKIELDRRA